MRKEEKRLKCTEKICMRRYKGTFDIFFWDRTQVEEG